MWNKFRNYKNLKSKRIPYMVFSCNLSWCRSQYQKILTFSDFSSKWGVFVEKLQKKKQHSSKTGVFVEKLQKKKKNNKEKNIYLDILFNLQLWIIVIIHLFEQ